MVAPSRVGVGIWDVYQGHTLDGINKVRRTIGGMNGAGADGMRTLFLAQETRVLTVDNVDRDWSE